MRVKYNQKSVDYLSENLKNQLRLEDFSIKNDSFFTSNKPLYLEIGPGKGKFIIDLASKNLDKNFIVVEINKTIAGYCLKAIDNSKLENVKLIANDFYKLVDLFDQEIFDGIFLNFSDPWPKKRHEKRRLTSDNFLKAYFKILKMNHCIYFKTDNYKFYEYSYEQALKYRYKIDYNNIDYKEDDLFDSLTEYELKYINKGIKINRMILRKVEDTLNEIN